MNALTRMALPVPAVGTAIGEAGDAYVDSLGIQISVDGRPLTVMGGTAFEWFMLSLKLRHLSFHPRTRAFMPGEMKAPAMTRTIGQNWSSLDSASTEIKGLLDTAAGIENACRDAAIVSWSQVN